MKKYLIANEKSGSANGQGEALDRFVQRIGGEKHIFKNPEEVRPFARKAIQEGKARIIVAGGDGSLSTLVNAIAPDFSSIELGVLPMGTGNDLARSLGIDSTDFDRACEIAEGGRLVSIDVVSMKLERLSYFINAANGGFGGSVAKEVTGEEKKTWGPLAYWLAGVTTLAELSPYEARLEIDGAVVERPIYGVSITNGRYAGGGFKVAPDAVLNDGLLDVTLIPEFPSLLELFQAGANFALGLPTEEGVQTYRAKKVVFSCEPAMPFSVDGELMEFTRAAFEILPGALRVVVGEECSIGE